MQCGLGVLPTDMEKLLQGAFIPEDQPSAKESTVGSTIEELVKYRNEILGALVAEAYTTTIEPVKVKLLELVESKKITKEICDEILGVIIDE